MSDIGLYVHIPFCRRRCDYCDFTTEVAPESAWLPYLEVLKAEIRHGGEWLEKRPLHSVYFGGGTPSLLDWERISEIFQEARNAFMLPESAEVTLEANPETLSRESLTGYRNAGFNRLSLGVQSFQPSLLHRLNRYHTKDMVEERVCDARLAGFQNLSLDLIYGLPGQTESDWQKDLSLAVMLAPEHLSLYELTLEPWTPMGKRVQSGEEQLPDEDVVIGMYEWALEFLSTQGFEHYEISNFARSGRRCTHNERVWKQGEYLGVGLAAHSHLNGRRFRNPRSLSAYLGETPESPQAEGAGYHEIRRLTLEEKCSEALILGLRLTEGVDLKEMERRLDCRVPAGLLDVLENYKDRGLLMQQGNRYLFTPQGRWLSDCLFADLVIS